MGGGKFSQTWVLLHKFYIFDRNAVQGSICSFSGPLDAQILKPPKHFFLAKSKYPEKRYIFHSLRSSEHAVKFYEDPTRIVLFMDKNVSVG